MGRPSTRWPKVCAAPCGFEAPGVVLLRMLRLGLPVMVCVVMQQQARMAMRVVVVVLMAVI